METEKNIPLPKGRYGKWVNKLRDMDYGDSFIVEDRYTANLIQQSARQSRYPELKVITRKQPDGTIRVWKTKP